MPLPRIDYTPMPAVIPRRVVDTRTLGDLLRQSGESSLQYELARRHSAAQLWQQLGQLFSSYAQGRRSDSEHAAAQELKRQEKEAADQLKRDELAERKAEREEAARVRKEAEARQKRMDAEKLGTEIAESVGYGPMAESDVDPVMQSSQSGRVRYAFGPGTAEGPELLPTKDQQRMIEAEAAVKKMGGIMGPNGAIHMPPRPPAAPTIRYQRVTALVNGRPAFVNYNPETKEYTDLQGNPVNPSPIPQREPTGQGAINNRIVTIGNSFKSESVVKKAQTMAEAVSFVNGLDLNTQNPADDQALIYAFAKVMDPDSVVREGEYATVQKYSQSLKDKFGFDIARLFSNTPFLTPDARKSLKTTIEARWTPIRKQYQNVFDEYVKRINKISGQEDGSDWLTDYGVAFPAVPGEKKNPFR